MAREFANGLARGERAAIGVTAILCLGAMFSLVKLHGVIAPGRAPLNRMWRWARDARTALAGDRRPPVLLLRSFDDEALATRERPSDFAVSVEKAIGRAVSGRGPLIAIGNPGEAAPDGHAYRTYLSNDEWQEVVLAWISDSQLIVVILGTTEWVRWELENICRQNQLGKTLVLLPPTDNAGKRRRWETLAQACLATNWGGALASAGYKADALLVQFGPSGQLGIFGSASDGRDYYQAAILSALCPRFDATVADD